MLTEQYRHQLGRSPAPAEQRSWERSLTVLADDLHDAGLGEVEVLVEYQLPLTSKRADAILCGTHPVTGGPSYVVVELKQWSRALLLDGSDDLVEFEGQGTRLHPVEQVRGYCRYLTDYVATLSQDPEQIAGVAYLHNATDQDVAALWLMPEDDQGRLFTGQRRGQFHDYLRSRLAPASGVDAADLLLGSAVKPSKQLLTLAADEVQRREQFVLLDQQQAAYSMVMRAVERARTANTKEVVVITGGPGSGKSVIALSLLGELSRQGRSVLHATGSKAFTSTLRKVAGARDRRVRSMFKYFNQFGGADPNGLEVLILDEAHRLRETSANRYTRAALRTGKQQVAELIDAARVPVFLLDQHQVVRPGEIGTVADIRAAASAAGVSSVVVDLDAQFRCGGSRAYEEWVLRLLGLAPGGPTVWEGDANFAVAVAPTPSLMEQRLRDLVDQGFGARIAAGYTWKWSDPIVGGGLVPDVVIGDWSRPWNNKKDTSHAGAPGTPYWASDPAGFEQVGCVYTAQGFEYDYAGVIMGADFVWRGDRWESHPERSFDTQAKRGTADEFDRAVRNTYKVLLTRGMRGTTIFSTDPETQALLEGLVFARVPS
ncbi:DNA/RNA helicase domain-containing protein [Nocardioides terrisoli]|uniref:DNA/RNA helicase domain-containing protein n=1 Tax=Nocardioides terrisoli TaxID=3388267 RepID=UPI00287B5CC6|nr:DNA/RNA helicase domain-containing protein [Nocardioides marmorisolisilvae]